MPLADSSADSLGDCVRVAFAGAGEFLDENEALAGIGAKGDGDAASRTQTGGRSLHRLLEVLGIVVPPADDEEVFHPTGHEDLVLPEEAEVASAHRAGRKHLRRQLRTIPVAVAYLRTPDPDLAHCAIGHLVSAHRMDDGDFRPGCG